MKKNFTLLSFMSGSRLMMAALLFIGTTVLRAQTVGESFTTVDGLTCTVVSDAEPASVAVTGGSVANDILSIPATVENGGTAFAVTAIADEAFKGSNIVTLDLTAATNLQRIGVSAFAECKKLETVTFPAADVSCLTEIGTKAFCYDFALKSMNLEDTHIEVLETIFTLEESDEISIPGLTILRFPYTLKEIKSYALQCLDITEIRIPSTVTTIGDYVLQGCINLQEFTWKGAQITSLPLHTFAYVGESLIKVTLLTMEPLLPDGLTDKHFYRIGADPSPAEVTVTRESIDNLATAGYTNDTAIFSTLVAYDGDPSDPDTPTAIAAPKAVSVASADNTYYNLQGQRITAPQRGHLYIYNGHKVFIR